MSNDWHNIIVSPSASVKEAMAAIDREGLQIALVADDEKHLLGTVTDGDIRRALLQHIGLDAPVSQIMNDRPRTANPEDGDYIKKPWVGAPVEMPERFTTKEEWEFRVNRKAGLIEKNRQGGH